MLNIQSILVVLMFKNDNDTTSRGAIDHRVPV